jgi:RimJ/RimL family protein N-acetyltransferase
MGAHAHALIAAHLRYGRPMAEGTPPAYRITTARTVVRCWEPSDARAHLAAVGDSIEHMRPWLPWAREAPTLDRQLGFLRASRASFDRDEDYVYGVFSSTGDVVGGTGMHTRLGPGVFEIGYWIHSAWIGRGLATEVTAALTRVAFEVHSVDRVEIRVVPDNLRSARVVAKLGFRHEATLRRRISFGDDLVDMMVWVLFRDEYETSVAAAAAANIAAFDAVGRPLL